MYSLGQYQYLHQGHCGGVSGHIQTNTIQETIDDCLKECKCKKDAKFFAYVPSSDATKRVCACYKMECLDDGKYMDHTAYEINEDGNTCKNYL